MLIQKLMEKLYKHIIIKICLFPSFEAVKQDISSKIPAIGEITELWVLTEKNMDP